MLQAPIELSMDAVKAFWRWENQDRIHPVLVSTVEWMDDEARRDADRRAWEELSARGLVANGAVRPEVRAAMHALARPDVEFYGWIGTPARMNGVLAAASGPNAALSIRIGDVATVYSADPQSLAETVVGQLPNVPPAHGRSLNVPEADLVGGANAAQDEGFDGFHQVNENLDVRMLKALMAQPANGGGQLHAAMRANDGQRRATTSGLTFLDVPEGRWLTMTTERSGQRWVIATPATPQLLVGKLYELLRDLG